MSEFSGDTIEDLAKWLNDVVGGASTLDGVPDWTYVEEVLESFNFDGADAGDIQEVLDEYNQLAERFDGNVKTTITKNLSDRIAVSAIDTSGDGEIDDSEFNAARDKAQAGTITEEEAAAFEAADDMMRGNSGTSGTDASSSVNLNAPPWFLDKYGIPSPTDEQVEKILADVNEERVARGEAPFTSLYELPNMTLDQVGEDIATGMYPEVETVFEPFTHLEMKYGPDFTMKTDRFEQVKGLLGFNDDAFKKTLEVADAFGLRREGGNEVAWQPAAMLMSMTDHIVSTSREERQDVLGRIRTLGYEIKRLEEAGKSASEMPGGIAGSGGSRLTLAKRERAKLISEWRSMSPTERINGGVGNDNLRDVFDRFTQGIGMYGNIESLAMLHAVNPGLAARLWESNGDVQKIDPTDVNLAGYYLGKALPGSGSSGDAMSSGLVVLGYSEAGGDAFVGDVLKQVDYFRNPEKYAPDDGSGSGRTRMVPDRMAIEQNARDTMEILYPTAASDEDVQAITDRVMQEAAAAPLDQEVNLASRVRQYVEELPQYGEFYGNKPGGVTDSQYQNVMMSGAESMLGAEAGLTQSGALGMKSGKYQTAVGAAAGTSAAFDNSTFMGRLAQAAQVTSQNT